MKKIFAIISIIIFLTTVFSIFNTEQAGAQHYPIMEPIGGAPAQPSLQQYLGAVFKVGVIGAAILTVVVLVIGGIMYISAAGNPGKIENARGMMVQAILGLLLILISYLILQAINPNLVSQGLTIPKCDNCIIANPAVGGTECVIKGGTCVSGQCWKGGHATSWSCS